MSVIVNVIFVYTIIIIIIILSSVVTHKMQEYAFVKIG